MNKTPVTATVVTVRRITSLYSFMILISPTSLQKINSPLSHLTEYLGQLCCLCVSSTASGAYDVSIASLSTSPSSPSGSRSVIPVSTSIAAVE